MCTPYVLQKGDWLDVVDEDGIWNVAQVLRLPTPETVEVTYDGWGSEYNETVERESERIAPLYTHTWVVKCWAKMESWPWWPALATVRPPGSADGSENLRLEERLLVDFLDREIFAERCRCWVEKSKIVPYQAEGKMPTKLQGLTKRNSKAKGDAKLSNLELSTSLLASCTAREDFPKFVEGTLPVQFKWKITRPIAKVRKDMGEEMWMREFADNRVNHAATHAYIPLFPKVRKSGRELGTKSIESLRSRTIKKGRDSSYDPETKRYLMGLEHEDVKRDIKEARSAQDSALVSAKKKCKTRILKEDRKRSRRIRDDERSDITNRLAEPAKAPFELRHGSQKKETHLANVAADTYIKRNGKKRLTSYSKQIQLSPRKYRKTSKLLHSSKKLAACLPQCTLLNARTRQEEQLGAEPYNHHLAQTKRSFRAPHAKNSDLLDISNTQSSSCVAIKNLKAGGRSENPLKSLARLTKSTLRVEKKLQAMEANLNGKLTEFAVKSAKAQQLRSKCAALHIDTMSASNQGHPCPEDLLRIMVPSSNSTSASAAQSELENNTWRESKANGSLDVSPVPILARKSSQAKFNIRELELLLDEFISKELTQSLSAIPTPAELDAVKAKVLKSSKVQAAIAQIEYPFSETDFHEASLLADDLSCGTWEKAPSHFNTFAVNSESWSRKPPLRSTIQLHGTPLEYQRASQLDMEDFHNSSSLLDSSITNSTFSINDNFSINQWYRDLYPKAFELQRKWR